MKTQLGSDFAMAVVEDGGSRSDSTPGLGTSDATDVALKSTHTHTHTRLQTINAGEGVEKREHFHTVSGNVS